MPETTFIIYRSDWDLVKTDEQFLEFGPKYKLRDVEASTSDPYPKVAVTTSDERLKKIIKDNAEFIKDNAGEAAIDKIPVRRNARAEQDSQEEQGPRPKVYNISTTLGRGDLREKLEKMGFREGKDFEITLRFFKMNEIKAFSPKLQNFLDNYNDVYARPQEQARLEPQQKKKGEKRAIA